MRVFVEVTPRFSSARVRLARLCASQGYGGPHPLVPTALRGNGLLRRSASWVLHAAERQAIAFPRRAVGTRFPQSSGLSQVSAGWSSFEATSAVRP